MKPVSQDQIDAILPFLDKFEEAGFSAGKWNSEPGHFPWFNFDEAVIEFVQALHEHDWITPEFDWTEWQDSAQQYVGSPERIASISTKTIQKLLTAHIRKDRFCEGHLAAMFENGHLLALLQRLRNIRETMGG